MDRTLGPPSHRLDRPARSGHENGSALALAATAAAYFLLMLSTALSPHYGFYSDELYYLACADRPDWGYVDHPPLFVWLLRLHRTLFGDSLLALRMLPAATGAATVFLTGWMARRMGGGLYAQVLAALAAIVSPQLLVMSSFFSMNCLEILLWTLACWILLELLRSEDLRLWGVLGAVLGLSFLTKHTVVILIAGLAAATLLSPLRRHLLGRWPWLGALAFLLIALPNLGWQLAHGWPSLAFYRSVPEANIVISPLSVFASQVFAQNPATLPIWGSGVFYFLISLDGRRYRPLGWIFVVAMILAMLGGLARSDRISGAYPVVFAGGAVFLAARRKPDSGGLRRCWDTWALPTLMLAFGLLGATLVLPVLPPALLAEHPLYDADEGSGWRTEVGTNRIPYHLGNRTHWPAFVETVEAVVRDLEPGPREGAIILADYFGHAGALEHYGARPPLPPVYSPHTGYLLWGPPAGDPATIISIGNDEALLRDHFEHVSVARVFRCTYCPPWVNELPIHVAISPKRPFSELWAELGRRGGMDRRRKLLREQAAR